MQYTFEDFKNTKIAVRISNKRQLSRFLDNCEKNGVSFMGILMKHTKLAMC